MQYSKADLRAADMLAMIFVGFGIFLVAWGAIGLASGKPEPVKADAMLVSPDSDAKPGAAVAAKTKLSARRAGPVGLRLVLGVACLCLGFAVNLKVRQLKRTGGVEPSDEQALPQP